MVSYEGRNAKGFNKSCRVIVLAFTLCLTDAGSSPLPCNNGYRGTFPASEPETQALQKAAVKYGPTLATSVHIHTAGEMWLTPWGSVLDDGFTCNIPEDYQEIVSPHNINVYEFFFKFCLLKCFLHLFH